MKKSILLIGCLALLVAGCSREKDVVGPTENPQEEPTPQLIFNITVNQEDSETRAVKTEWEAGDKVYIAFDDYFGDPNTGKAYYLTLTFDGTKWSSTVSDPALESYLVWHTNGRIAAAYTSAGFPNGEEPQFEYDPSGSRIVVTNATPGFTMNVGDSEYFVEKDGFERSVLTAVVNMKLFPVEMVHFFIEGVSEADAARYSFENEYIMPVSFGGFDNQSDFYNNWIRAFVNFDTSKYGEPIPADYYSNGEVSGVRFCGALHPSKNGVPDHYVLRITDNRGTPDNADDDFIYTYEPANNVSLKYRKSVKLPEITSTKWTVTGNNVPELRFWLEDDPDNFISELHFPQNFGFANVVAWCSGLTGGTASMTVTCSEDWLFCLSSGWHISLWTLSPNESAETRVATITVTVTSEEDPTDSITKTFKVYQDGANDLIQFESDVVKAIAVANWDTNGDGGLSYAEAAAVTSLDGKFSNHDSDDPQIPSSTEFTFDELQYFTGLTSIGANEFYNTSLTSVVLPSAITCIETGAFAGTKIKSIAIPEGVTKLGQFAFESTPLQELHIPASVTQIGLIPTNGCNDLSVLTVNASNPVYSSPEGSNAIVETSTKTLVVGCVHTVIPDDIVKIGQSAFTGYTDLHSIEIPASVQEIGPLAFVDTGLRTVVIPETVTTIGMMAFHQLIAPCELTSVVDLAPNPQAYNWQMFGTEDKTFPIYVPALSVEAYKTAWPYYADRIKPMDLDASFEKFNDEKEW